MTLAKLKKRKEEIELKAWWKKRVIHKLYLKAVENIEGKFDFSRNIFDYPPLNKCKLIENEQEILFDECWEKEIKNARKSNKKQKKK